MFADLHLHTFFSDGTYAPEEMVMHARGQGLTAIALTDHDTVEGCPRTQSACAATGIDFLPGTELTAEQDGVELHILGYCFDPTHPRLLCEMTKFQQVRQDRIREIVSRLNSMDVPLDSDQVFRLANCRAPGRPHVARALVQAGLCDSLEEAFERFLKKNRPAWVPKFKMSAQHAIAIIHEAGGVAAIAHPGLNNIDHMIPAMVEAGLDGIECFHTKHTYATAQRYVQMAAKLKLLVTGGSDCHGTNKGKPLIGTVKIPMAMVQALKSRAVGRQRSNS